MRNTSREKELRNSVVIKGGECFSVTHVATNLFNCEEKPSRSVALVADPAVDLELRRDPSSPIGARYGAIIIEIVRQIAAVTADYPRWYWEMKRPKRTPQSRNDDNMSLPNPDCY